MQICNIRHEIDPDLVRAQIASKIADHERKRVIFTEEHTRAVAAYEAAAVWRGFKPEGPEHVDPMIDRWIDREREHYALVRVIELPQKGPRFILVYGDADDATVESGTGPFKTLDEAKDWFLGGGR